VNHGDQDKLRGIFAEHVFEQEQVPLSLPEQVKLEAGILFQHAPPRIVPEVAAPENFDESSSAQKKRKAEGRPFRC
jgi:hypothetical protein